VPEPSHWTLSGDARLRLEFRSEETETSSVRGRLRLREEVRWVTEEGWTLALGLSSGHRGDPRDPDWLIGEGSPNALIRPLPLWIRWPSSAILPVSLTIGRMPNPLLRVHDLLFDGDWHPVGASIEGAIGPDESRLRAQMAAFWLADMGVSSWRLHAAQLAWDRHPSRNWRTLIGGTVLWHAGAEGREPPLPPDRAAGNSLRPGHTPDSHVLAQEFHLCEAFALATWDPWLPLTVFGQTAANTAASSDRTAWLVGISAGTARAVGGVELGWSYRELQADATLAALADSDFGGTSLHAHRLHIRWQPIRNIWLTCSWRTVHPLGKNGRSDFDLWQADLLVRF